MNKNQNKKAHISFGTLIQGLKEWNFKSFFMETESTNPEKDNEGDDSHQSYFDQFESFYDYEILWI